MPSVVKLTLESNQYERNIKNAQKSLDEFTRAVGLNTKSLSTMALAAGAVTTALKVSKDAFNQSRDLVDEWGRTVQSAQSLYEGFLNAINNGDFSGFINNMGRITQAAREAYDAISDLELYNAFNGPNMADARTGLTEAIADYRSGTGNKESVQAAGETLKKELEDRRKREYAAYEKVVGEEAAKIGMDAKKLIGALKGTYVDFENLMHSNLPGSYTGTNVVPSFGSGTVAGAMTGGFSGTRIMKTPGTDEERLSDFARRVTPETLQKLQQYAVISKQTANEIASTDKMISRILGSKTTTGGGGGGGTIRTTKEKDDFQEMEEVIGLLNIQKQRLDDLQALRPFAESEEELKRLNKEIETANEEYQRLLNLGKTEPFDFDKMFPSRGISDGAFSSYGQQLRQSISQELASSMQDADMNTLRTLMQTQIMYGLDSIDIPSDTLINAIIGEGLNIPDEYWEKLQSQINDKLKEMGIDELNIDFNSGEDRGKEKKERSTLEGSKQLVSGLTQVAGGLQQMGITIPEEVTQILNVVQGLMTVIEGVNLVIGVTQTAALTANTTAMIALTSALWANTFTPSLFANGGIVPHAANGYFIPGSRFSGDTTPIMANAGELVLNKAQQGNLASQLNGGGLGNLHLETYLDGRAIRIVLNNDSQSRMKGKYVTSRNYRG